MKLGAREVEMNGELERRKERKAKRALSRTVLQIVVQYHEPR